MTAKTYHHGDLRAALVEAGLKLVATREAGELSLREVAAAVGVSATAVYRHFADKNALMSALAAEGFAKMAAAQHAASDGAGGGIAGFNATGRAYVRFALENPALFRLMFANPAPRTALGGALDVDGARERPAQDTPDAMSFLLANAAALASPGAPTQVIALQAWSLAHGLSLLMLDGQVQPSDRTIDAVIEARSVLLAGRHSR